MIHSLAVHALIFFLDTFLESEYIILRYFMLNILKQGVIMFCISQSFYVTNSFLFLSIFEFINTYDILYTSYISSMSYNILLCAYIFDIFSSYF